MLRRLALIPLLALSLSGADFYTGQAARAVIGQSTFSAHESGINAIALSVSNGRLYAADSSGKLFTFDVSTLTGLRDELPGASSGCTVCLATPIATTVQNVAPGTATVSVMGNTLAAVDVRGHRVLIWRDVTAPSAMAGPDVVLQAGDMPGSTLVRPVSVAFDGRRLFVGDAATHSVLVWRALPTSGAQMPDAILGGHTGADSFENPAALVSDGTNLFVADPSANRILVFSPADVRLAPDAVLNAASQLPGGVAGGTLINIMGGSLADTTAAAVDGGSQPLPSKLAGVEVYFDGVRLPLISVSSSEVRGQLPYGIGDLASASLYVRTQHSDGSVTVTNAVPVTVSTASPGIFAFAGNEPRPGMALHATEPNEPVTTESPAAPGESIRLWVTGLHVVSEEEVRAGVPFQGDSILVTPVQALVNGEPAEVKTVSLPSTSIGVYEVTLQLPPQAYPDGTASVLLSEDGISSNAVSVAIRE